MWDPTTSPRCQATPADRAGRVHHLTLSAALSRRLSAGSLCFSGGILLVVLALLVPTVASANSHWRCFGGRCFSVAGTSSASTPAPSSASSPAPEPGGINLAQYPTSFSASGYTYTGRRAQVLHYLQDRFGTIVTTYAEHSDCPTCSADLWPPDGRYDRDNTGLSMMNDMAEHIRANVGPLGIKYVIWNQRYSSGGAWSQMENRGSLTANHKDHVHITFRNDFK